MGLLNYEIHSNPAGHKDILSKFKTFAQAQGWTIDQYLTSQEWKYNAGTYEWMAGNEDFLQIRSAGYGNQNMVYRFRAFGEGSDPQAEKLYVKGIDPNHTAIESISTHPVDQNAYNTAVYVSYLSLSPGTTPTLWLFGNDKILIMINKTTTEFIQGFVVGSPELFDPAEDEGFFVATSTNGNNYNYKWYDYASQSSYYNSPFYGYPNQTLAWYDGAGRSSTDWKYNAEFYYNDNPGGSFNKLTRAVGANNFTGKRTLIKPTVFVKRQSDGVWFPLGTLPVYLIEFAGLTIGETLTYGTEQYLAFPNSITTRKYGFAVRIA